MKYSSFISLLILFGSYSGVQCGFFWRVFDSIIGSPPPEPDEPSIVLGIEEGTGFCTLANVPIITNKKDPTYRGYLFACPAETDKEMKINNERSRTKNALFIKDTYGDVFPHNPQEQEESDEEESMLDVHDLYVEKFEYLEYGCEKAVTPSVRYIGSIGEDQKADVFLVGFEVFIGKKYEYLNTFNFADYTGVVPKHFEWFNVLTIRFDSRNGNVLSVQSDVHEDLSTFLAPRFQFGEKTLDPKINNFANEVFYPSTDVESHYLLYSQNWLINGLFDTPFVRNLYFNISDERHLVENHLAPLDSFATSLLEQTAHTYGNIAPMWKSIKDYSWVRVENHIKHLIQGINDTSVISGTYGTLMLRNKELFLGPDETNRVPSAFWKIVQYIRLENETIYQMLIVVSNNPYGNLPIGICPVGQCRQFGWQHIEEAHYYPAGITICCEITEEIISFLGLDGYVNVGRTLNLWEVPHWENEELTLNLTKFIEDSKNRPMYDPSIRADDEEYRNQPDFVLDSERNGVKKVKNYYKDGMSFSSWLVQKVLFPYINSLSVE